MHTKKTNQQPNLLNTEANPAIVVEQPTWLSSLGQLVPNWLKLKQEKIAVLRLEGVIGKVSNFKSGLSFGALEKTIDKTFATSNLKAVCLIINSPGGSPVQAELITARIQDLAMQKNVPVYAFVEDVAASGGYWLALAAEKIFVSRSSIIGSIGVISSGFGFHEAIHKLGIERRIYTQGQNKSILDPFTPTKAEDVKVINKIQKAIHQYFIEFVKKNRLGRLTQSDDILFNGEFWPGEIAVDYGLVDGIDNLHNFIRENFDPAIKIEYIEPKQSWFKRKLGMNMEGNLTEQFAETLTQQLDAKLQEKLHHNRFNLF